MTAYSKDAMQVVLLRRRRLEGLLAVVVVSVCVFSILMARDYTRASFTRLQRQFGNMQLSLPSLPDLPDLSSLKEKVGRFANTTSLLDTDSPITTVPTPASLHLNNFRQWFDDRTEIEPHRSKRPHPLFSNFVIDNKKLCGDDPVDLLIYFHSAWDNVQRRRVLRETWAGRTVFRDISVRTVFLLGRPSDPGHQIRISNEHVAFGDIVQGDFIDSFRNLTLKSIMALRWINDHCPQARYVLKADDDIFVNVFKVAESFLPQLADKNYTVMCHFKEGGTSKIIRDKKSKWYIPPEVFRGESLFPPFCSGYVALFTADAVPGLYKASFRAPFIPVDDVYLFGLLSKMSRTPLSYIDVRQNFTLNNKVAIQQYKSDEPLTYVAASAWDKTSQEVFWVFSLRRLSGWAKERSSYAIIHPKDISP